MEGFQSKSTGKETGKEFIQKPQLSPKKVSGTTQPLPDRPVDVTFSDALICLNDEIKKYLFSHPHTRLTREECVSIVYESFLNAYDGHDPSKGPFLRRVRFLARHAINDYLRQQRNKIKLLQETGGLAFVPAKSSFDLDEFLSELSPDANNVWSTVYGLADMERLPQDQKKGKLIQTLLEQGWTGDRIVNALQEIAQALADWYKQHEF